MGADAKGDSQLIHMIRINRSDNFYRPILLALGKNRPIVWRMSRLKSSHNVANSEAYPEMGSAISGRFNWLGLWTLYRKEVRRFTKVWMQTLMAPIITTLLFLAIFSLALAGLRPDINGVPFINFFGPGLIMMSIVQNAFANSASSLLVAKVQGNLVDFLMPPLSPLELNIGITMGGLTRGLFVGFGHVSRHVVICRYHRPQLCRGAVLCSHRLSPSGPNRPDWRHLGRKV